MRTKMSQNGQFKNNSKKQFTRGTGSTFSTGNTGSSGISDAGTVNSTSGLSEDVSSALQSLPIIQKTLQGIQDRLNGLEGLRLEIQSDKEALKEDLWGADGIGPKLEYVAQQAEGTSEDVDSIYRENQSLRREVDLLKAVVIKLDRKVSEQDREIIDLKSRSMRDNLMIHRFKEIPNENLMEDVPNAIKKEFGVDLKFVRIHRVGPPRRGPVPRLIVGKLENYQKKEEILKIQRDFRRTSKPTAFHVSEQFPAAVVEERKYLYELQRKYTSQNVETRVRGNKLVFKNNGNIYREKVLVPRAEDVLYCDEEECQKLQESPAVFSDEKQERGSRFMASGAAVKTYGEVRNLYKKICSLPKHAQANHRILVYRFRDKDGKLIEGSMDDGEFGAGRNLLQHMEERGYENIACIVTRWYGGEHLGTARFGRMREVVDQVSQKLGK